MSTSRRFSMPDWVPDGYSQNCIDDQPDEEASKEEESKEELAEQDPQTDQET